MFSKETDKLEDMSTYSGELAMKSRQSTYKVYHSQSREETNTKLSYLYEIKEDENASENIVGNITAWVETKKINNINNNGGGFGFELYSR